MKKLITPMFLFCASIIVAQTATDDYYSTSKPKLISADRVSASISAGAGVGFLNSSNNSYYSTYVAPKVSYQLTNKFKLNIGLMHYTATGNTFMPINYNEGIVNTANHPITGNLIFVGGEYQLNKKFIVSGALMADASNLANKQTSYKAGSLGLEYKVTDRSSIKLTTTISQGQGNYYNQANSASLFPFTEGNMFGTGFSNPANNPIGR